MDKKAKLLSRFDALAPDRRRWKDRNRYYYEDQERYFRFLIPEGRSVLELGCGTGELLASLKPARGVGIDFSPKMVTIARKAFPELEFREADIEELEGWGETFDFVIMADVLGHLQDIEEGLRRVKPFCRADTRIIISYYNFLWEPLLKLGEVIGQKMPLHHQNWLSSEDISNLLYLTEYQVVKTESRLFIPKRIPLLSRFINRYIAPLPGIRRISLCRYIVARPAGMRGEKELTTTVLVPCRNEEGNVEAAVQRIPPFGAHQEIIFVEGGSTDNTPREIERVMEAYPEKDIKFLIQEGKGKGDAVRKGFAAANGEVLMILDGDLTMPPEDLPKYYRAIRDDLGEFINGCRLIYPMEKEAMRFLNLMGNKFFSLLFTWILNQRLKDTLCGTKVLYKRDYEKIQTDRSYFGDFDPFGDFDLLFGAAKQNLKIVEVPIRYRERTYGRTNISRFRHGWLLLKMTLFAFRKIKAI
jgi:SAM-dependent methyltransferase